MDYIYQVIAPEGSFAPYYDGEIMSDAKGVGTRFEMREVGLLF